MSGRSESREYENGVADVVGFLLEHRATVTRNVRLAAKRSGGTRQIDVLVRGDIFGIEDATLVIDCKRYGKNLNVNHVDQFLGLLDDVGADLGILVTTKGASAKAVERLRAARGARVRVMSVEELERWSPPGSATVSLRLAASDEQIAASALREAGFRVRRDSSLVHAAGQVILRGLIRLGRGHHQGQAEVHKLVAAALGRAGVAYEIAASGVTIAGGTPAHRWLDVTDSNGTPIGVKISAASEEDVDRELSRIAATVGTPRGALDVARPQDWPGTGLFQMP